MADNHERIRQSLEWRERASEKGRRKWMKAIPRQLLALRGLFTAHFTETTTYSRWNEDGGLDFRNTL